MAELIVALDVPSRAEAEARVKLLGDAVDFYKIGLELFTAEGPDVVKAVKGLGKKVFLDLKFHDIPNTAAQAVRSVRHGKLRHRCNLFGGSTTGHADVGKVGLVKRSQHRHCKNSRAVLAELGCGLCGGGYHLASADGMDRHQIDAKAPTGTHRLRGGVRDVVEL